MALLAELARRVQCRLAGTHPSLSQAVNHSEPFPESSLCLVIATEAVFEATQCTAGCKAELGLGPISGLPCPRDGQGGCGAGGGSAACGGAGMLSSHGCFLGRLLGSASGDTLLMVTQQGVPKTPARHAVLPRSSEEGCCSCGHAVCVCRPVGSSQHQGCFSSLFGPRHELPRAEFNFGGGEEVL